MVLSKREIEAYLADGRIVIDPKPDPEADIDQVSIDLHLGRKFTTFKGLPAHFPSIRVKQSLFSADELWLREELDSLASRIEDGDALRESAYTLTVWQDCTDLAAVRDAAALEQWSELEQDDWRELWAELAELLKKARR